MRTLDVVPVEESDKLGPHPCKAQGNEEPPCQLVLQREDESFGDRNAAVSSDRPEARLHAMVRAPLLILAAELHAVVGDDVLGIASDARC